MVKTNQNWSNSWWLKMSEIFLYFLVFCLPLGTRLQWLNEWSYYGGNFCEYLTIFTYFTDIILLLVLGFWLVDVLQKFWFYGDWDDWKIDPLLGIVLILFVIFILWSFYSMSWSHVVLVTFYRSIRLLGLFGLVSYFVLVVRNNAEKWRWLFVFFLGGMVCQVFLALYQYYFQHDMGLWWLGESILGPAIDGVAKIDIGAEKFIRAYGTLPHANILAFYLFVVFGVVLANVKYKIVIFVKNIIGNSIINGILLSLCGVGLLLTYSRVTWLAVIILLTIFLAGWYLDYRRKGKNSYKDSWWWLVVFLSVMSISMLVNYKALFVRTTSDLATDISVQTRQIYDQVADKLIEKHYYNGWGNGSFVYVMPYFSSQTLNDWMYQPVHNYYKLVWSELGVVGFINISLVMLVLLFFVLFGNDGFCWLGIGMWIGLLIIQLFDHYTWDIWQGQLLWAFLIGFIMSGFKYDKKNKIMNRKKTI